ncbi:MAG TPA: XRE family transcriptional regulator [Gaiellaceae bacterium]|nr:XRE family transcriptional regulator [Gaiellaceae bacterium]
MVVPDEAAALQDERPSDGRVSSQSLSHLVGARLKRLRQQRRLTLQEVATAVDLSHSFLSMVERGQADVSMARLHRLASFYGTPLSELLVEELPTTQVQVITQQTGQRVERSKGMTLRLLPIARELGLQLVHVVFEPHSEPSTPVSHDGEDFLWVLAGEVVLVYGADEFVLKKGQAAVYSARVHHFFVNRSPRKSEMLSITTPPYARIAALAESLRT